MKIPVLCALLLAPQLFAGPVEDFIAAGRDKHGPIGERAAKFLAESMPAADRASLSAGFLIRNLDLAMAARAEFPWAKTLPEEVFFNDVLPYAVLDETREEWRASFLEKARPLVKDARTAAEAAQILNREFFKLVNVHYNTGRKAANQSPSESMASGRASCTGLSIILVDACRAVGIAARAAGTPMWTNGRGNHTWVEIWDGSWQFAGADEYDAAGLNRGWFAADAAKARADVPLNAIYASSWRRESGVAFPLVWAPEDQSVGAVNVTARYVAPPSAPGQAAATIGVRLFEREGGGRLVAKVRVLDGGAGAAGETKAGTADLNDMPRFALAPGAKGRLLFTIGAETRSLEFGPLQSGETTVDAAWDRLPAAADAR